MGPLCRPTLRPLRTQLKATDEGILYPDLSIQGCILELHDENLRPPRGEPPGRTPQPASCRPARNLIHLCTYCVLDAGTRRGDIREQPRYKLLSKNSLSGPVVPALGHMLIPNPSVRAAPNQSGQDTGLGGERHCSFSKVPVITICDTAWGPLVWQE